MRERARRGAPTRRDLDGFPGLRLRTAGIATSTHVVASPIVRSSRRRSDGQRTAEYLVTAATLIAVAVAITAMAVSNGHGIGQYGLVTALPDSYFGALTVLLVGFGYLIHTGARRPVLLAIHVFALIALLDGAPALLENSARLPTAWLHVGFAQHIAQQGDIVHNFDARFSWPGFFAAVAMVTQAAHLPDGQIFIRWAPALLDALYLGPLLMIARALVADRRVQWLGVGIFYAADWVGQAYFSPQGFAYLLLLTILAMVLTYCSARGSGWSFWSLTPRPLRSLLARAERRTTRGSSESQPLRDLPVRTASVFGLIALISIAMMPSHQLTPVALLLDAFLLLAIGRMRLKYLPWFLLLIFVAYVSYGATEYWYGHLDELVGSGGGSAVQQNFSNRIVGSDPHLRVVRLRLVVTASVFGLAAIGALRAWRQGRLSLRLIGLTAASFPLPLVQAYGGEALLRVVFYSLPFSSLLAAEALISSRHLYRARNLVLPVIFFGLLLDAYPVARYGNESFEQVTASDVNAVAKAYEITGNGATLYAAIDDVPWRNRDLTTRVYVSAQDSDVDPRNAAAVVSDVERRDGQVCAILTTTQEAYGTENYSYPAGWVQDIAQRLSNAPGFQVVYHDAHADVLCRGTR